MFLRALARHGNASWAARAAGVDRSHLYKARRRLPDFAAAWQAALIAGRARLEAELVRPACEGWAKPAADAAEPPLDAGQCSTNRLLGMLRRG